MDKLRSNNFSILGLGISFILLLIILFFVFILHISLGSKSLDFSQVINSIVSFDPNNFDHVIVRKLRLPRAIIALFVGGSLAISGALMQGLTRNPLAGPSILGLSQGASFLVVVYVSIAGADYSPFMLPLFAVIGALLGAILVWSISLLSPGGPTALTLVLSGSAVTAFLGAIISSIKLIDQDTFVDLRVWLSGSLAGRDISVLWWTLPWLIAGIFVAFSTSRHVTTFAMGDETAVGLGVNVSKLKFLVLFSVISLSASSVALAGPIGFIGLVIPHVVRLFAGYDYRVIIPYSCLVGAIYLLFADIVARMALRPIEISTGLVTAILGAPLFVWLVRVKL